MENLMSYLMLCGKSVSDGWSNRGYRSLLMLSPLISFPLGKSLLQRARSSSKHSFRLREIFAATPDSDNLTASLCLVDK